MRINTTVLPTSIRIVYHNLFVAREVFKLNKKSEKYVSLLNKAWEEKKCFPAGLGLPIIFYRTKESNVSFRHLNLEN